MTLDLGLPAIVADDPRYQREIFTLFSGKRVESRLWHLDGVAWHDVPPPTRRGHEHVAQTVGYLGLFDEVWRCPCSAIRRRGERGWLNLEERYAEEPPAVARVRRWFRRGAR